MQNYKLEDFFAVPKSQILSPPLSPSSLENYDRPNI